MIGIYKITNKINGKSYYGSAKDIKRRWTRHKSQLNHNRHENRILQRAWNKYGNINFSFEIVELCEMENLLEYEQKYLDLNPEYNIGKQASGGDNMTNHPDKLKIIVDRKTFIRSKINNMSKGERKSIWSRPKEMNGRWKSGSTYNYCACGKKIAPINKFCINCLSKEGENNPFYGKKHSERTKKRISESRKGKYFGNQNLRFIIDGIEYSSLGEASNKLGIPITTIRWRLKSKNEKFNNYKYNK